MHVVVRYKKGKQMHIADTLSRTYLPKAKVGKLALEVVGVDHTLMLVLPAGRLHQFSHASADDPVLSDLRKNHTTKLAREQGICYRGYAPILRFP